DQLHVPLIQTARQRQDDPDLAAVSSLGESWETAQGTAQRQIWALRLTNSRVAGPKPRLLVVGLHHAREIVTPEAVLGLAQRLLTERVADVDVAWLLDTTEIWLVPMVNPDGHARAVSRQDWRKNADEDYCGKGRVRDGDGPGVDLNRNYGYRWGGVGASPQPCDSTFRGPAAFSEPESAAVRDLIEDTAFDLVVSLHAFSGIVLYPWGYTKAPAPDAEGLTALAAELAAPMGYEPRQSAALYVTSGDTCDWAYGAAGIPCVTFELGTQRDGGFWPSCAVRSRLVEGAVEALVHAVRLAPDPLSLALGPRTTRVRAVVGASEARVSASLETSAARSGDIAAAELFFDRLGPPGGGLAMEVTSRMGRGSASLVVPLREAPAGGHYVLVRGADDRGRWGPAAAGWLMNGAGPTATPPPTATAATTPPTPAASETSTVAAGWPRRLVLPALLRGGSGRPRLGAPGVRRPLCGEVARHILAQCSSPSAL
ncbi:MAG: M14 family metallopeptidase, partial [Anaerolineae bacterium]